ncbi:hypothetical protein K1W54_09165 [Micromonospora sp. CPCC 205371]|nr:hypothetical protein [Micromonospora sp. CPCC 205371]
MKAAKAPDSVRVEVLDRASAKRSGHDLAVRVSRADGVAGSAGVRVWIDYTAFASAYGGDWAGRLRLVRLPACALTTPAARGCQAQPLPSVNDGKSVAADVTMSAAPATKKAAIVEGLGASAAVVALAAGAAGGSGDYAATSLSPSATWSAGGSAGGFTWSYSVRTPPGLGGPAPAINLAYSSQAVDGRTISTNNQPSWVGEGFEYSPGYIERRYVACSDDMEGENNNTTKTGDQCWRNDNATMSLNGDGTELIYNAAEKLWHGRNEEGARIERKTGAANGARNGEYWVVTTMDGTKYYFGLNRLDGWTASRPETNSVLTVPVFGNHPEEPCHVSAFASSSCDQAYRWNLDYVVDTHGNTMSLWYGRDTNLYGRNNSTSDLASYHRDGYLMRIDYGTDQRTVVNGVKTDTVFTAAKAPVQVVFGTGDRCLITCGNRENWLDTPLDQECTGTTCDDHSPTFWSKKRLSTISTKVWNTTTSGYRDVERWTLTHSYPDPGDGTRAGMWLARLAHTGLIGGTASVPDIEFGPIAMDNRVDTALQNGLRPMRWHRMDKIKTEAGAIIDVNYKPAECVAGATPTAHANTKRCYPVRWAPEDLGQAPGAEITDWFHKYVVDNVVENDATGKPTGSPLATVTRYDYYGGGAWRYADDDGLTKDNRRTWNQWRGYELVRTTLGEPGEQTYSETRYFRGMHGDKQPSGTRTARVTDSKGRATIDDHDEYAGMPRETITYNGSAGAISGSLNTPWRGGATATRVIDGQTVNARFIGMSDTETWTALDRGRQDRWTRTQTELDGYGMASRVTEHGDVTVTGDEKCTLTDYARNQGAWLMTYPSRVRTFALTCADATAAGRVLTAEDAIADVKTSYDHKVWGIVPMMGEPTQVDELKDWQNNAPTFLTTKKSAYDDYGRLTDNWDVDNRRTGTSYAPAAGAPVTSVTTTNVLGWTSVAEMEPAWGATLAVVDANGRRTAKAYDPLGRLTGVWYPGRNTSQTPNTAYTYTISNTAPSVVETKMLNPAGAQVSSYALYDALLRPRQTQAPSATGTGRIVTDTHYDSAGRSYLTWGPYWEEGAAPSGEAWVPDDAHERIDIWHRTVYDGAGRPTAAIQFNRLVEKWRTTTTYGGDSTTVVPPPGGTATTTVVDAQGRTTQLMQHRNRDLTGTPLVTTYGYDRKSRKVLVRDSAGTEWRFGFDLRSRQVFVDDPDKGESTTVYDDAGRVVSTVDGRGTTLAFTYDPLDRKTGLFLGSTSGTKLAAWGYDGVVDASGESISRGMMTSSTRYVGGAGGSAYIAATTAVDAAGRATQSKVTIPAGEIGLAGTYQYDTTYKVDGSLATTRLPAIGGSTGLGIESLTTNYQATGIPTTLATTLGTSYVVSTNLTEFGESNIVTLRNNSGKIVQLGTYYEASTRRLNRIWSTRETSPSSLSDLYYSYDHAGNIKSVTETSAVAGAETQCFGYDFLRRLTEAWTPAGQNCDAAPTAAGLGGPAPYWTSWVIDDAGNRKKQTERVTAAGTRITDYTYPAATASRPHTVSDTSTTDNAGTRTATYAYDGAGNTMQRPTATSGAQTLTWDAEGHLATNKDSTGTTSYLYDADGKRLIRTDPNGSKTLYLPGQELKVNATGQTQSCVRYYSHGGKTIATRTPAGVTWLLPDHQGTSRLSVDALSQAYAIRRQDPYGNQRGSVTGTWPAAMDKGFVGGTKDDSGLTHLGAREYDPLIGRFISVDPIVDFNDPQQAHGYSYSNNTPVTMSDPDGLRPYDDAGSENNGKDGKTSDGKKINTHSSDDDERRATGDSAKAHRIRQHRYKQIMEGKFGIRAWLAELVDEAMDRSERQAGGGKFKPFRKAVTELTEDMIVSAWIEEALERIDESRNDGKVHPDGVTVAFDDDEFKIAFRLAFTGREVESRDENLQTVGNPDGKVFDAYVDGVRSEFKSVFTNSEGKVYRDFSDANKQHAVRLYMWTGDDVEPEKVKEGQNNFWRNSHKRPNQSLQQVMVMGEVEANLQDISEDLNCAGIDWLSGC